MRNIDIIHAATGAASGRWPDVLAALGIHVPASPRAQVACPACGGKDRFRFDDYGRGSHICNQCGAGDGLELVKKVRRCDNTTAARLVAEVLNLDVHTGDAVTEASPLTQAEQQAKTQERERQAARREQERRTGFVRRYDALSRKTTPGESGYLNGKGFAGMGFMFPVTPEGVLVLPLTDHTGTITAAQTLTPEGEKRLVTDSAKRGAFYAVNAVDTPEVVILAEGLATALSVHVFFPDALTVCAVDAGNLLPVAQVMRERYPSVRLIVAADNDSEPGKPNKGKYAAEKAAAAVDGLVALPPGETKADWNDLHQQQGREVVLALFKASLYSPGVSTMKTAPHNALPDGKDPTARQDPNDRDPLKPFMESGPRGVWWIEPQLDKKDGSITHKETWLCDPLEVYGEGYDRDSQTGYIALRWWRDGEQVTQFQRAGLTGDTQGWAQMKDGGFKVTTWSANRARLADWIQREAGKGVRFVATPRAGWFNGAYILPDGDILGEPDCPVMFTGGSAARSAYSVQGTAEEWREKVASLAAGNPFQMLAAGAALAAPMTGIVNAAGFGIHLYADSTAGKTTAIDFASSLYGLPDMQRLSWYGTALGIANEAEAHNHGLLVLDEIGQAANPQSVHTSAYTLFNGKGKLQGSPSGGNRDLKHWRTVVLSTGETSVETYLESARIRINAGQLVRLLNVPVTRPTQLHGYADGKKHAEALEAAWTDYHGAAGRAWIAWLAGHKAQTKLAYREAKQRWDTVVPAEYGEQVHRVKDRFAILEAALMLSLHITGWEAQACRDALEHVFRVWVAEFGTGNKEYEQIIRQATGFLMANSISRFIPVDYDDLSQLNVHHLAGYMDKGSNVSGEPVKFYVLPEPFRKEVAQGFDANKVARVLSEAGILVKPASNSGWQVKTPRIKHLNNAQVWTYALLLVATDEADP